MLGYTHRRDGVTLTEVLVAIFVTGIGLLSLMSLFPLGAMNMAAAIKDQKAADAARNAEAVARILNVREDSGVFSSYFTPHDGLPTPSETGPSYPVYVDPQGFNSYSSPYKDRVGGVANGIVRVGHIAMSTQADINRWLSVHDDMSFDDGAPRQYSPLSIQREGRYSWAYLCRQVRASTTAPTPYGVDLTVVVYDRRPPLFNEPTCTGMFTLGSNVATLSWSGTPPPVRRGTWILDATLTPEIHGYFYRVVNTKLVSSASMQVELHQNARAGASTGTAIVMENVVEVFEKGAN